MSKYSNAASEYVHGLTLDQSWVDAQCGDVQFGGWFGLVTFNREAAEEIQRLGVEGGRSVYDADTDSPFTGMVGAIVTEDSQGFVDVTFYAGLTELMDAWEAIEREEASDDEEL